MGSKGRPYRTFEIGGFDVLVGKRAVDNDLLSLELAEANDFWMHVAEYSGSHVVIRNPDDLVAMPRDVETAAARLAAWYSKARGARGKVDVHVCFARDVSKPRGFEPGKVRLARWWSIKVYAKDPPPEVEALGEGS